MTAVEVLRAAQAAGLTVALDGDDLVLEASAPPAPALLEGLRQHKAAVVALLRAGRDGWTAEDWHSFFGERAGIAEFDGGLPRAEAEARAFTCCVGEWLSRNPVCSPAGRCVACEKAEHAHDPLLPFGTEATGHAWLHSRCWASWYAYRKAEAVTALAAIGIITTSTDR